MDEPSNDNDHPAVKAATLIKELHQKNIELIDSGYVFFRTQTDGTKVNVNDTMRLQCTEQIKLCDRIIAQAHMLPEEASVPLEHILQDLQETIAKADAEKRTLASMLPEIGNYGHETN